MVGYASREEKVTGVPGRQRHELKLRHRARHLRFPMYNDAKVHDWEKVVKKYMCMDKNDY